MQNGETIATTSAQTQDGSEVTYAHRSGDVFAAFFIAILVFGGMMALVECTVHDWMPRVFQRKRFKMIKVKKYSGSRELNGFFTVGVVEDTGSRMTFWLGGEKYYNMNKFDYNGKQVIFYDWEWQAEQEEKKAEKTTKKKGRHMPRIFKFLFYAMMLLLVWKFVSHSDQIVAYLLQHFIK